VREDRPEKKKGNARVTGCREGGWLELETGPNILLLFKWKPFDSPRGGRGREKEIMKGGGGKSGLRRGSA